MSVQGLCCVASQHMAAAAATAPNQAAAPSSSSPSSHVYHDIVLTQPFAWSTGQTLRIGFTDGNDWQKYQVRMYAMEWCRYANLALDFNAAPGLPYDILISFAHSGSWSQLGTYSLYKTYSGQASMNFGWMWPTVPATDLRATVLHEFGHALGLVHEHQNQWKDASMAWNINKVYQHFRQPPNNWSDETIQNNVLKTFSGEGLTRKALFDIDSIMLYTYPKELFQGGEGTPKNLELSLLDKGAMFMKYPGRDMGDLRYQLSLGPEGMIGRMYVRGFDHAANQAKKDWDYDEISSDSWLNK